MARVTIDNLALDVPDGLTILQAAQRAGIAIPTLCHHPDFAPNTSCLVCLVNVMAPVPAMAGGIAPGRMLPACATRVSDGMVVESETPAVHEARKTALELLLSDHVGDCVAPCARTCPTHMEIPGMLAAIAQGDFIRALAIVKHDMVLPVTLGCVCPAPCENTCHRAAEGGAIMVCALHRWVGQRDLVTGRPWVPPRAEPTGRHIAIVGAGPAGLSAAYHLALLGHEVTVFDDHPHAGGMLRYGTSPDALPRPVLDAEIGVITALGVHWQLNTALGRDIPLAHLQTRFAALILAAGSLAPSKIENQKSEIRPGFPVSYAGAILHPGRLAVRSVAEGKRAAFTIHHLLTGSRPAAELPAFLVSAGKRNREEVHTLMRRGASPIARQDPSLRTDLLPLDAIAQAQRCLQCGCAKIESCRLRRYAQEYGARPHRFPGAHRPIVEIHISSRAALSGGGGAGLTFDAGKCIACGLCLQVAAAQGEPLGLAWRGRGLALRPSVPFHKPLAQALTHSAQAVLEICPTGAFTAAPPTAQP